MTLWRGFDLRQCGLPFSDFCKARGTITGDPNHFYVTCHICGEEVNKWVDIVWFHFLNYHEEEVSLYYLAGSRDSWEENKFSHISKR